MKQKLIFVYNADSSLFNKMGDLVHKAISPKTYQCNLCGLTYGVVSIKNEWREFIDSLPVKTEFLHKDEFLKAFSTMQNTTFPVVFVEQDDNLVELISTQEINQAKNLEELKNLVLKKTSKI